MLFEIVGIKKKSAENTADEKTPANAQSGVGQTSTTKVPQPDPTVKEQFSLKDDSSVDERLAMMRDKYGTMPKGSNPSNIKNTPISQK